MVLMSTSTWANRAAIFSAICFLASQPRANLWTVIPAVGLSSSSSCARDMSSLPWVVRSTEPMSTSVSCISPSSCMPFLLLSPINRHCANCVELKSCGRLTALMSLDFFTGAASPGAFTFLSSSSSSSSFLVSASATATACMKPVSFLSFSMPFPHFDFGLGAGSASGSPTGQPSSTGCFFAPPPNMSMIFLDISCLFIFWSSARLFACFRNIFAYRSRRISFWSCVSVCKIFFIFL